MTKLVVETQDCRVGDDWRFGKFLGTEAEGSRNLGEILKEDTFLDVNKEACAEASRELWSVLATYTSSGASTTVKSVTDLEGVEAWSKLHANYSGKNAGEIFRVQRASMHPKTGKGCEPGETGHHAVGRKVEDHDVRTQKRRLLEIFPKDVKEQMMM